MIRKLRNNIVEDQSTQGDLIVAGGIYARLRRGNQGALQGMNRIRVYPCDILPL